MPLFIPFDQLFVADAALERIKKSKKPLVDKKNDLINAILQQKTLEHYVFNDLNTVLCREQIRKIIEDKKKDPSMAHVQIEDLKAPNLNDLKLYILRQQSIAFLSLKEARMLTRFQNISQMICKRYNDIFKKLSAISIDGFKRERYVQKLQFLTNDITKAQHDLLEEEKFIESGALTKQSEQDLNQSIQRITDLMLAIEKQTTDKINMEKELKEKEQKWIENDTIFKERRVILNYIIQLNLDQSFQAYFFQKLFELAQTRQNLSQRAYEIIFFGVQHIIDQNRLPSVNFMAEIEQYIQSQQEETSQLNNTQNELTSKLQAIEEEIREMRKKIDEIKQVCDLKESNQQIQQNISSLEIKLAHLKKQQAKNEEAKKKKD